MKQKIAIPDKVSKTAARIFKEGGFEVEQNPGIDIKECNSMAKGSDAVIVRSYKLHELEFSDSLKAIGRAGAGVNNIPVDKCTEKGVVVFNTPGANANAVKELVLCGLLLSSRKIVEGVNWTVCIKDSGKDALKLIEKNKSKYKGSEIQGKTLGVIGLGAIGLLVANDASKLGMNVVGYDPFLSVESAWKLSSKVKRAKDLDKLFASSDYISIHVPLNDKTRGMLNKKAFAKMKKGVKIMNFSRDGLADTNDLIKAIGDGAVGRYVTDFPNCDLIGVENLICIPHLGASTKEAEENCAAMVANQLIDFLKDGTITNSVNFPACFLERNGNTRITIVNENIPTMIEKITQALTDSKLNITEMINKSRGDIAYSILDIDGNVKGDALKGLEKIEGVIRVRKL